MAEHWRPDGSPARGYYCPNCGAAGMNMLSSSHTGSVKEDVFICEANPDLVHRLDDANKPLPNVGEAMPRFEKRMRDEAAAREAAKTDADRMREMAERVAFTFTQVGAAVAAFAEVAMAAIEHAKEAAVAEALAVARPFMAPEGGNGDETDER